LQAKENHGATQKDHGELLVKEARKCLETCLSGKDYKINGSIACLDKKCGIFVSPALPFRSRASRLHRIHRSSLSIAKSLKEAALSAAFHDYRFPPVTESELNNIIIEISILSEPELISHASPKDLLSKIVPKKDGLILKNGMFHGLFLPQVWEELPDKVQFLENLCYKAGISDRNAWQYKDTRSANSMSRYSGKQSQKEKS